MYKKRDLQASHVRRIAQLRGDSEPSPEETPSIKPNQQEADEEEHPVNQKATGFMYHEPETEAELKMNKLWLENRQRDATMMHNDRTLPLVKHQKEHDSQL